MTLRGSFDPPLFVPDDPGTWPSAPGGPLLTDDGLEVLTADDDQVITTDEPWYRDGDEWSVAAAGSFEGLELVPGGRLIARVS